MAKKVIVGLSGGVDSSVACALLQQQGYQVEAVFMKNWEHDDKPGYCAASHDLKDAQAVADKLCIPLHQVNFSKQYWNEVFENVLDEYQKGKTPNPDVLCNQEIKFKCFLDYALNDLNANLIATGHYARVDQTNRLCKAKDRSKDQTYFLNAMPRSALAKSVFPIGDYLKSEVRDIAKSLGLDTHNKKDSTGLCFIGERPFKNFLAEFMLPTPGSIITTSNEIVGQHDGLMFYTIGQRQGLNIGGIHGALNAPWYVVDKNMEDNMLIVAQGAEHPRLYAQGLICGPIHWLISTDDLSFPLSCYAKTRYRQTEQACLISPQQNNQHVIMFSDPQRAITIGQYVVFYDKHICLGGAKIENVVR